MQALCRLRAAPAAFRGRGRSLAAAPRASASASAAASAAAATAQPGDIVKVHYTGTLDDGSVFDTSRQDGREPLQFEVGSGTVVKGFDLAVTGLAVGGTRTQRVEAQDAYGERRDEYVVKVPKARAPEGLAVGDRVQLSNGLPARVAAVGDAEVELDLNHELAGKALTFDVELMALTPAARLKVASFGAGCFWGPQIAFERIPGVVATEVGYSQAASDAPVTYEQVCSGRTGAVEVVRVTYDPEQVPLRALLDEFWRRHDPTSLNAQGGDSGTQYRAGFYGSDDAQLAEAAAYIEEKRAAMPGVKIVTEVEAAVNYTKAEEEHQHYLARGGRFGRPQDPSKGCTDPIRCYG